MLSYSMAFVIVVRPHLPKGEIAEADASKHPESGLSSGFGSRPKPIRPTVVSEAESAVWVSIFGFGRVTGYRLYGLDGVNRVSSGEWIDADDDEAAIEAVKKMMDGHDCELWQGRRLVARIPHKDDPDRSA